MRCSVTSVERLNAAINRLTAHFSTEAWYTYAPVLCVSNFGKNCNKCGIFVKQSQTLFHILDFAHVPLFINVIVRV